ncbi:MAG: ABC transporter substrate-binding protein [Clostridiales bacterium]|nr:ABC transporter substrate-binding protein [Clostridiales bacterium]
MKKKIIALALFIVMLLSLLAGCGGGGGGGGSNTGNNTSGGSTGDLDYVEMTWLFIGDPPGDAQMVQDAINEKLMEKLNCRINIQMTSWTDWDTRLRNELIAGNVDVCYTASWLNYVIYANEGAFMALDDILPSAAPDLYNALEPQLNMMKVKGQYYALPNLWPEYVTLGIMYREDLRKKLNLPVPNSMENMETYLLGIQQYDPEQTLISYGPQPPTTIQNYFRAFDHLNMKYNWISLGYGLWYDNDNPSKTVDYWYSQDFIDDCKLMKKWADLGFWSRSALSDTNLPEFVLETGLSVATWTNPNRFTEAIARVERDYPDWEVGFFAFGECNGGGIWPAHARQNATAIASTCKNPERALQAVEYIMLDEEMHNLFHYGIEGLHYEVRDGNYYSLSPVGATEPFKYEGFNSWNLRNGEFKIPLSTDKILLDTWDRLDAIAAKAKYPRVNIPDGFQEDYSGYEAERIAVINVMVEYLAPIQAGLVNDVEASIADFLRRAEAAGLQKCRESYDRQFKEYLAEFGYE